MKIKVKSSPRLDTMKIKLDYHREYRAKPAPEKDCIVVCGIVLEPHEWREQ